MYDCVIPSMGMDTSTVDIMEWKVKVGDKVKKGDPILEIESEKTSLVIESEESGIVKEILYEEGDTVKIGEVVCRIG